MKFESLKQRLLKTKPDVLFMLDSLFPHEVYSFRAGYTMDLVLQTDAHVYLYTILESVIKEHRYTKSYDLGFILQKTGSETSLETAKLTTSEMRTLKEDWNQLLTELKAENYTPKSIICIGSIALEVVTKKTKITEVEFTIINSLKIPEGTLTENEPLYTAIKHPINYQQNSVSGDVPNYIASIEKALHYAFAWTHQNYKADIVLVDTFEKLEQVEKALQVYKQVVLDIETSTLEIKSDLARVLCISLTWKENQAYVLPWMHPGVDLTKYFGSRVQEYFKRVIDLLSGDDLQLIMHNGKYDSTYLRSNGIPIKSCWFDTMMAHYIIVDERPKTHGLKRLAWIETDRGGYEECLENFFTKFDKSQIKFHEYPLNAFVHIPFETLWYYNGLDTIITFALFKKYSLILDNPAAPCLTCKYKTCTPPDLTCYRKGSPKWKSLFFDIIMPAIKALGEIEEHGAVIDLDKAQIYAEYTRLRIKDTEKRLNEFPEPTSIAEERYANALLAYEAEKAEKLKNIEIVEAQKAVIQDEMRCIQDLKEQRVVLRKDKVLLKQALRKATDDPILLTTKKYLEHEEVHLTESIQALELLKKELLKQVPRAGTFRKRPPDPNDPKFQFNYSSNKDLRELLYDRLKLKALKTTQRFAEPLRRVVLPTEETFNKLSTDQEALEYAAEQHPIPALLAEYNQLDKLYGTYLIPAPGWVQRDGKIHASHLLHGAVTGRTSCANPNLQNLPSTDKTIKKLFISQYEGGWILNVDLSQAELRILACITKDKTLVEAYRNDRDLHREVAAKAYGIAPEDVTEEYRARAKCINFGLAYGRAARSLAPDMGVSVEEAEEFIARYFENMPEVKKWLDRQKEIVQIPGQGHYVENLFGFRRRLFDACHSVTMRAKGAGRQSVNSPIQGSSAQYTVAALTMLHNALNGSESYIVATVHDSIVIDVPNNKEAIRVGNLAKDVLEQETFDWQKEAGVTMKADVSIGINYGLQDNINIRTVTEEDLVILREQQIEKEKKEFSEIKEKTNAYKQEI